MARDLWQGRADGLCGIYCALKVIRNSSNLGSSPALRDSNGLRLLLKSAEHRELLTADKLAAGKEGGFHADELVAIFNGVSAAHRNGYTAVELCEVAPDFQRSLASLHPVFDAGGQAMIDVLNGEHWILAESWNGKSAVCFDPSLSKYRALKRQRASSGDGVAFIPTRELKKLLNAQTH